LGSAALLIVPVRARNCFNIEKANHLSHTNQEPQEVIEGRRVLHLGRGYLFHF